MKEADKEEYEKNVDGWIKMSNERGQKVKGGGIPRFKDTFIVYMVAVSEGQLDRFSYM